VSGKRLTRFAALAAVVLFVPAWAADNGVGAFSAVDYRDAGAYAIDAPSGDSVPPGPMFPRGTVHNFGDAAVQIPARFDIYRCNANDTPLVYSSTDSVWVEAGANGVTTFDQWVATCGGYLARLTTTLAGDQNPANDTLSAQFVVRESGHDLRVFILAPIGIVDTLPITPRDRVTNFGSYTETFGICFWIQDSAAEFPPYIRSEVVVNLEPGATADVDFPVWGGHTPEGRYYDKSWAVLSEGITTDTARASFLVMARFVDVGITAINIPTAVDSGTTVTPCVTVRNYGNDTASLDITFSINISPIYISTVHIAGLSPDKDTVVNGFAPWLAIQRGVWTVRCSLYVYGQLHNDTGSGTVTVNVHDLGAEEIVLPVGGVPPIIITPEARVRNYGTLRESCAVEFGINSSPPYSDTKVLSGLPVGADTVLAFADWSATIGSYTAKCSTYLATDQVPGNDVVTDTFQVGLGDVGVTEIISPGDVDTSAVVTPSAVVHNFDTFPADFPVRFTIASEGDAIVYVGDTMVYSLAGGGSVEVTFPVWPKPHPPGMYAAKCSTMLAGDMDPTNDARYGRFSVRPTPVRRTWAKMADLPPGGRHKNVREGGALAYEPGPPYDDWIYALKGNNTCEFYRCWLQHNAWMSEDSIPAVGRSGKRKGVKNGSSLTFAGDGRLYATKGNNTREFWQYDPIRPTGTRWTEMVNGVPTGGKACKEGTSSASVEVAGANYVYLLKGSGTHEFYRYDAGNGTWETLPDAPSGLSGRPFKSGSSIAYDGGDTIYCMKGSYNEFFAYSIGNRKWVMLETLPKTVPYGARKTKVKDGSQIAYAQGAVYALKGGNTNELWRYACDSHRWYCDSAMPTISRKVKGGGALVAAPEDYALYALRGNNTLEFWKYWPFSARGSRLTADGQPEDLHGESATRSPQFELGIAPNPFASSVNPSVSYSLPTPGNVSLRLFDITGKLVSTLVSGYHPAGRYACRLPPAAYRLSAGVYLLKFECDDFRATEKLILE